MSEDKGDELKRRGIFGGLVHTFAYIKLVVKPAFEFSSILERTSAIIRKEAATTWSATKETRL